MINQYFVFGRITILLIKFGKIDQINKNLNVISDVKNDFE